ncbi:ATP-binding response regulator [Polaromonas naphthalenivorans]|uniref:histidine kinase n=1 Tax=Polaromonas naphthalenivorans (strain CJ2) TaxID=365044 RepID=A1VQR2_POLNA|nr:ATP-binding protein [Polaromonas naphthalenivorans]ABM37990.1 integral membrane sensor hybrid histidine kinase [Polaromonas naphthalenivorans CJ2]
MPGKLLWLTESHVLVEQVRLLCANVGSSVIPTFVLLGLLFWVLSGDVNVMWLGLWCALTALSKLCCWLHAKRQLSRGVSVDSVPRLVWMLIVLNALDGAIWGALPWVALDSAHLAGSVLVIAVLTGVAANSMSLLSPVLPVFVGFVIAEMIAGVSKLFLIGDPAYSALGIAGFLYFAIMMGQAINIARTARTSIDLRFENIELMDQLRKKTAIAEAARHEAEEANAAKSKFLAAASHDLRQPIHAQGLFLEVLGQSLLTAHQREVLDCARSASLASSEMLNTLLDFSRIDAGVVRPHIQPFQLQTLLHKIENDLAPLADAKGMVYRSRETRATINSDATLVEMILRNLVSNAIRYTERGGVLITCRKRRHLALVEVWDTGIGIAFENQQDIFREFHQLGNPERDRRKGLGLGLAIADGLAKALGRDLSLSSRPGRGSVFRLALPLSHATVAPVEPVWKPDPAHLQGMHVLVVDDDEAVVLGMAQLLQGWGCRCDTAGSIADALALARMHTPNVVISDYRLREQRTGAEAIAALRGMLGKQIPALMITGDTAPERLREAMASDVPLLHKPVAPDQLYRALGELMRSVAAG